MTVKPVNQMTVDELFKVIFDPVKLSAAAKKIPHTPLTQAFSDCESTGERLVLMAGAHGNECAASIAVASWYIANESGASLKRPELFRLLSDSSPGDVLLIEQVDRLSCLTAGDWQKLRAEIDARQVKIVALDLPTSWMLAEQSDAFMGRVLGAINGMMLDLLSAVARKDYDDRRRRQAQGIERARAAKKFEGRKENVSRNANIAALLASGTSWSTITDMVGCSRSTVARIADHARSSAA
jgi:DNA invertase Pin-like site-specific DNA recombinase